MPNINIVKMAATKFLIIWTALLVESLAQDIVFPTEPSVNGSRKLNNGLRYEELRTLNASCHPKDTCVTRGRRIDDIRDQTCGCDNGCVIYDNCCIDAHIRKPSFLTRMSNKFACLSYMNIGYIFVKDSCPSYWTGPRETVIKCQSTHEDYANPLSFMPATNRVSGTTYKNYYCAECNSENATSITIWQPLVEFTNLRPYNSSYGNITSDYIKRNLAFNGDTTRWGLWLYGDDGQQYFYDATIYPMVPRGLEERVHSCRPGLITNCSSDWNDDIVSKKCQAYQGAIYVRGSGKGYRNAHCAMCNREDTRTLTCTPPKGKSGFQARTFNNEAFSVLLDFHDPNGGTVGTNNACPSGQIYDPFHKSCKKILCGFPWLVVKDNKCVPISTNALSNSFKVSFPVNDEPSTDNDLREKSDLDHTQTPLAAFALDTFTTETTVIQIATIKDTNVTTSTIVNTETPDAGNKTELTTTKPEITNQTSTTDATTQSQSTSSSTVLPVTTNVTTTESVPTSTVQSSTDVEPEETSTTIPLDDFVFVPLQNNSTDNFFNFSTTTTPQDSPTIVIGLRNDDITTVGPSTSRPYYPYRMTVVTHPPDERTTDPYSVSVMASTESISTILSEETLTDTYDIEESTTKPSVNVSTVAYHEKDSNDSLQVIKLSTQTPAVLKPDLDSNSSLVNLGEPPQSLDYEDNRQYVADSSVQYDFNPEFINCTKIGLDKSQYVLYDNSTLSVPAFDKTYDTRNYLIIEGQALVCAFFQNVTEGEQKSKFDPAMGYITFIGLGISILCLVLHLIVYLLVPEMRNLSTNNLAALSLSLLMAYMAFIAGQFSTISKTTCLVVAAAMYFFFLASFFWMSAMSFDVWRTLRLATRELRVSNGRQWKRFLGYSIYSWGLSAVALITVMIVDNVQGMPVEYQPQFGVRSCWFAQREALLVFFAAPLIAIMLVNIMLFVSSARMVLTTTQSTAKNYSCTTSSRRNFKLYLRLAVMMGLTWAVGLIAGYLNIDPIWYAFIFLNTLQGLFIFVAFTCNRKVKKHLGDRMRALTKRHAYRTSSLNSNSTYPSSSIMGHRTATITSTSSMTSEIKTPPSSTANQRPLAFVNPPMTSFQQLQDGMETLY